MYNQKSSLEKIYRTLLDLIFPPRCYFCSKIIDFFNRGKYDLCRECLSQISFIGAKACKFCGKQLKDYHDDLCEYCQPNKYYIRLISACEYDDVLREKLLEFKFEGKKELYKVFSLILIEKLKMTDDIKFDIIISVPIHESKLKQRGYNQTQLIAQDIAKKLQIEIENDVLIKSKITKNQSELNRDERKTNIINSFIIQNGEKIKEKRILLIDDIVTTGATVNECSRMLKENGAKEVFISTVATGKLI